MMKKLKDNFFTVGLIVMVLAIGVAVGTYAYYQTTVSGNITGTVIAWDCNSGTSVSKQTFEGLYPGSSGYVRFVLNCSINADYTITFSNFTNMVTGTRSNLKLYKTKSGTVYSDAISSGGTITGSITGGTASNVDVYYNWPYGSSEAYITGLPSFQYSITYSQK